MKNQNTLTMQNFWLYLRESRRFVASGIDGNRTRVQRSLHRTSTSVVCILTFPLRRPYRHGYRFSSFIIRLHTQSLICIVSYIVDAWIPMCRCIRSDSCN